MSKLSQFYSNKVIVITGAGSGIGLALAECLAKSGAHLALCDIDKPALDSATQHFATTYPHSTILKAELDVAQKERWAPFLSDVYEKFGYIDMLVNNAGIEGSSRPVWATDDQTLERVMNVNFYGMVHGSKAVLPYLVKRDWSALVNVSSIFGLIGPPNTADYAASKFAIRGYTEALHAELSMIYPQVQVHLVHPGGINTHITRSKQSQRFKSTFLTTPPSALANVIARSVMHNNARIVYGNQSTLVKIAARLLPLSWLSFMISKEMLKLDMTEDYHKDHPGLSSEK